MTTREVPLKEKSIVFIGFMGVGKTTIGKLVAKKLFRSFVDIDDEIEKEYGMPTSEIFKQIGEKAFRQREKDIITELSKKKLLVISVGGGAFLQEDIREACLNNCVVFFLDLSWDYWKDRISLIIDSRPVLQGRSIESILELFNSRQEIYQYHHSKINTDNQAAEKIADYIVDSLKLAWDLY